jgi:hypothetical protein
VQTNPASLRGTIGWQKTKTSFLRGRSHLYSTEEFFCQSANALFGTLRRNFIFYFLGAFPALRAGNRAIRLYLFCLRQKRIPLLSLARSQRQPCCPAASFRFPLFPPFSRTCSVLQTQDAQKMQGGVPGGKAPSARRDFCPLAGPPKNSHGILSLSPDKQIIAGGQYAIVRRTVSCGILGS